MLFQTGWSGKTDNMSCEKTLSEIGSELHGMWGKSIWAEGTANRASCVLRREHEAQAERARRPAWEGERGRKGVRVSWGQATWGLEHGENIREAANSQRGPEVGGGIL